VYFTYEIICILVYAHVEEINLSTCLIYYHIDLQILIDVSFL